MNATTTTTPMTSSALVSALTSDPLHESTESTPTRLDQTARLTLGGSSRPLRFDGTWWPRTRNLVDELPALIVALRAHGIPVARVAYQLDGWDAAPRRLTIEGKRIRLGGFRYIDPDQLSTVDLYQTVRMNLEVIRPGAPVHDVVHEASEGVEELPRWETDGGPVEPAAAVR
jgi:hypothetical protein